MSSPVSTFARFGSDVERLQLQEILRRKLVKIPPHLYPNVQLNGVMKATGMDNYYPYHR